MRQYSIKNFFPLIGIISLILVFTVTKQMLGGIWDPNSIMFDFMGIFFIVFGSFKIINLKNFAESYAMYDLIAKHSTLYALLYPFIEFSLGIFYVLRWQLLFINVITLLLMLIGAAGVAIELSKKREIMCACLGMVFKIPMTYVTLCEDLFMALMTAVMIIWS